MRMKKKLVIVINNRANYARIRSFIWAAQRSKKINLVIILGASSVLEKFGNLEKVLLKDKIKISYKIYTIVDGDKPITMAKSTALEINELSNIFEKEKPDMVLAIADRYETMSVAIAASYMNIFLIHTQGGEITGSIDESVRHAITKLSNLHFPSNKKAAKNVLRMGEKAKSIFNVGCPSVDIAKSVANKKINFKNLFSRNKFSYSGKYKIDDFKEYCIVVQHPVTTEYVGSKSQIIETIKAINKSKKKFLWLWPNVDSGSDIISKQLRIFREKGSLENVIFIKNLSPEDFYVLLNNSKCIIGNSSVGIREGAYLGIPCINIGNRQNLREKGPNVTNCKHKSSEILKKINSIYGKKFRKSLIYGDGKTGKRMMKIILKIKNFNTQKMLSYN